MNVCIMEKKHGINFFSMLIRDVYLNHHPYIRMATLADIRGCNNGGAKYHVFVIGLYLSTDFKLLETKKKIKLK
ncbi:hypothetical protein DERP_014462, partial [Dermatophagoides pteronyssinus]